MVEHGPVVAQVWVVVAVELELVQVLVEELVLWGVLLDLLDFFVEQLYWLCNRGFVGINNNATIMIFLSISGFTGIIALDDGEWYRITLDCKESTVCHIQLTSEMILIFI